MKKYVLFTISLILGILVVVYFSGEPPTETTIISTENL